MLSPNFISELKTELETFGRLPAEDINSLFINASIEQIQNYLNIEFNDADIDNQSKLAILNLALFFYNNRDFQSKAKEGAVWQFVTGLVSFYLDETKYTDRDDNSTNSIESDQ